MLTDHTPIKQPTGPDEPMERFIENAEELLEQVEWLEPLSELDSTPGAKFGRSLKSSLQALIHRGRLLSLNVNSKKAAVIVPVLQYQQLVKLKAQYEKLVEMQKSQALSDLGEEFEALYTKLTAPATTGKARGLFDLTADELNRHYQPGNTETDQ